MVSGQTECARGELTEYMGLRRFRWREPGPEVAVKLLMSKDLPKHLPRIDNFEGIQYKRIWIPVTCGSKLYVANIYEGCSTDVRDSHSHGLLVAAS